MTNLEPHDLTAHWERMARIGARNKRDLESRVWQAIRELEKLGGQEKIINILKGE